MFLAKNKELLERFRSGEKEAMEEIYLHYSPGVHRFLRNGFTFRSGGGHCYFKGIKVEDELNVAVQEVFRRAFEERARNAYNGINSFSNWVWPLAEIWSSTNFATAKSPSVIIFPKGTGEDRSHIAAMDTAVSSVSATYSGVLYAQNPGSQDDNYEKSELKGLIGEFMKEITEEDRQLLVLRFVENISQEDAANVLGSTRMKVRTAEQKLRRRLRAFLSGTGYTDHLEK